MPRYRRVNSFKIMNDYKETSLHLKYISIMANAKNRRFFRINKQKIEHNLIMSKLNNSEKNYLIKLINEKDYHKIFCYAQKLQKEYEQVYKNYQARMEILFMTIEDKNVFYA